MKTRVVAAVVAIFLSLVGWSQQNRISANYKTITARDMKLPSNARWAQQLPNNWQSQRQAMAKYYAQQYQQRQQYFARSRAATQQLQAFNNKMKNWSPGSTARRSSVAAPAPNAAAVATAQQTWNNSLKYVQQSLQQQRQQTTTGYQPSAHGSVPAPQTSAATTAAGGQSAGSSGGWQAPADGTIGAGTPTRTAPQYQPPKPVFIQPATDLKLPPGAIEAPPAFMQPTGTAVTSAPTFFTDAGGMIADGGFFVPGDGATTTIAPPQWGDGVGAPAGGPGLPTGGEAPVFMTPDTGSVGAVPGGEAPVFTTPSTTGIAAPQWGDGTGAMNSATFATGANAMAMRPTEPMPSAPPPYSVNLTNANLQAMKNAADNTTQKLFEDITLRKMKLLRDAAKKQLEEAQQRTEEAEEIAGILEGYESPVQTNPDNLSIELQPYNPNEGVIEVGSIDGDPGAPTLVGVPSSRGGHPGMGEGNDGNTTVMREDGMVWSENYQDWVSPDIVAMDQQIADDFQQLKDDNAAARDESWREYWAENADPTFEEGLQEISAELKEAKDKVTNSDVAVELADYVEKYNDQHEMLSDEQVDHMREQLQKAVDQGASEEELKDIAKKYVALGMEEQKAIAAEAEEEEAYAELGVEMSKGTAQALGTAASAGTGFLAGKLIEGGSAFAVGCAENGLWAGVEKAFTETLPVNTALSLNKMRKGENVSYTEFVAGIVSDVASTFDLAGGFKGADDVLDTAGDAAKVNKNYDLDSLLGDLDLEKQNKRNAAYFVGRQEGYDAADKFHKAVTSGNPKLIKEAAVEIQGNKHALRALQEKPPVLWKKFTDQMDNVYDAADDKAVGMLKKNLKPNDLGGHVDEILEVKAVKVTNPSSTAKVSFDRDVTLRANVRLKNGEIRTIDIPPKHSADAYNHAYYEAATGVPPPNKDAAKMFAHQQDQVVTYKLSSDAYGAGGKDFNVAFQNKAGVFSDPEQVGQAMAYKSNEWYRSADDLNAKAAQYEKAAATARKYNQLDKAADFEKKALKAAGQAEAATEEGMRQFTKQYDKQLLERMEKAGLKEADLPPRLIAAKEVLSRVGTGPGQGWTPSQAESAIKVLGFGKLEDVGTELGKSLEALQKLKMKK